MSFARGYTHAVLFFDGASRGNPGPGGAGFVLLPMTEAEWAASSQDPVQLLDAADDARLVKGARYLGTATNNVAEFSALLDGLKQALKDEVQTLTIRGDSLLVVNFVNGKWSAQNAAMQAMTAEAKALLRRFSSADIEWVPREKNEKADLESNRALDEAGIPKEETPWRRSSQDPPSIEQLNREGEAASFGSFAALKVGGKDKFSSKKTMTLEILVGELHGEGSPRQVLARLNQGKANLDQTLIAANMTKLYDTALRWSARGLLPSLGAYKALVDFESSLRARGKR